MGLLCEEYRAVGRMGYYGIVVCGMESWRQDGVLWDCCVRNVELETRWGIMGLLCEDH